MSQRIKTDTTYDADNYDTLENADNDDTLENGDTNQNACCAICLESFQNGEDICVAQNVDCHHEFHLNCIFPWLLKSQDCPCCRRDYLTIIESRRLIDAENS